MNAPALRSALLGACREVERDEEAAALAGDRTRRLRRTEIAKALRLLANDGEALHLIEKEINAHG